jgi:hypothetical protein
MIHWKAMGGSHRAIMEIISQYLLEGPRKTNKLKITYHLAEIGTGYK